MTINHTTWEHWQDWLKHYTMLPYIKVYHITKDRLKSWETLWNEANLDGSFVLESGKGGRYTYFGANPKSSIRGKGNIALVQEMPPEQTCSQTSNQTSFDEAEPLLIQTEKRQSKQVIGSPLDTVRQWLSLYTSPAIEGVPKFIGGCVGYWSYDINRSIEKLPDIALDDLQLPDYYFLLYDKIWVIDHVDLKLYCVVHTFINPQGVNISNLGNSLEQETAQSWGLAKSYQQAENQAQAMFEQWKMMIEEDDHLAGRNQNHLGHFQLDPIQIDTGDIPSIETSFTKMQYENAVRKVQQYISNGDVFQVNLSIRQSCKLQTSPEDIYEWLRLINPSPYMGILRFPELQFVSGSPEQLVCVEGTQVVTRPIAGTRPRGASTPEDSALANELISNEKERAEHIMLVDLLRNDIGRVSAYGTVKVEEFMVIEYYSHVMHIVSQVKGQLAEGKDAYDVIAGMFPGGTITGAPKIRTMEIIEELEPIRRGPYTGSMGWIDYHGNMEFNITIRTLVAFEGKAYIQAGAGIVIDSIPEKEYMESLNKAKALWAAMEYSKQWAKMNKQAPIRNSRVKAEQ